MMANNKKQPKKNRSNSKGNPNGQAGAAQALAKTKKVTEKPTSVVGVGASAGGLEAFEQLLAALPADTGMAFVLVQHLAPKHESILSELLAKSSKMPVGEVHEGVSVEPNHVYVIP